MATGKYQKWLEPDGLLLLEAWARDGLTDEQIAEKCGCGTRTLYEWKQRYPQISQSLKKGKEIADVAVENALYKSALGYEYEETTKELLTNPVTGKPVLDEKGDPVMAVTKIVKKSVQPSNTAQIFWLKNRKQDVWRDKTEMSHEIEGLESFFSSDSK